MLVCMAGRFGRQHRDRQRRESKAQLAALGGSLFVRPDAACVETRNTVDLDDPEFRLDVRLVVHEEKLVEYAVVLSRRQAEEWTEVYSVDTRHGTLHEHVSGHRRSNDSKEIRPHVFAS